MSSLGVISILFDLGESLAVLFCGVAAYCWVRRGPNDQRNGWKLAAETAILSLVAGYGLLSAAPPIPGLLFDARFVVITLATLFSGPVVGAVVTTAIAALRYWIGGVGVTPAIVTAFAVFATAALCRRAFRKRGVAPGQRELFLVALGVSAVSMIGFAFVPWDPATLTAAARSLAALFLINPIGLFVLSALVLWDERTKQLQLAKANDMARFRAVVDNLPISLVIHDNDERITLLNKRYEALYGPEIRQFIGKSMGELRAHLFPERLDREVITPDAPTATAGRSASLYLPDVTIRGVERSVLVTRFVIPDANGDAMGGATLGVDVSELRRAQRETEALQQQLIQSSKMEAIGQLAGGIAHDFNNLLGAIMGYASFLKEDLAQEPEQHGHVEKILRICDRAKALVAQVLAFARADKVERRRLDLKATIAETHDLMRPLLPKTTELICDLGVEPIWIEANEGQIGQLVVNLCVNGSDALDGAPGTLAISLRRGPTDGAEAALFLAGRSDTHCSGLLTAGRDYIRLTIRDDGPGMTAETLKRVMEPFFTTNGRSDGTGLGLPLVHAIVMSYGGAYAIESAPGAGTQFRIYLPYNPAVETQAAAESAAVSPSRGKERVLIVDDEDDIRDVYMIGLERLGFEAACSHDPLEALEIFAEEPELWDVVISDEIMPGMNGTEMLRRMRALRPSLRTILCTGFGELSTNEPLSLDHVDVSLAKPIEPRKLAEHIRKLVDG